MALVASAPKAPLLHVEDEEGRLWGAVSSPLSPLGKQQLGGCEWARWQGGWDGAGWSRFPSRWGLRPAAPLPRGCLMTGAVTSRVATPRGLSDVQTC